MSVFFEVTSWVSINGMVYLGIDVAILDEAVSLPAYQVHCIPMMLAVERLLFDNTL